MFHIVYIFPQRENKRRPKGYGGQVGFPKGHHKDKSYNNPDSLLFGNGCFRHGIISCSICPMMPDCDFDYAIESKIRCKITKQIMAITNGHLRAFKATWNYLSEYKLKHPVIVAHIARMEMEKNDDVNMERIEAQ